MQNFLKILGSVIVSAGLAVTSLFGVHQAPQQTLGTSAPQFVAAKPTFLYGGGIASTDASIKLTALVTPNGTPITTAQLVGGPSGVFYGTIEPATTKKETISCTGVTQNGDGTALITGCVRGLQFTAPYTASTTLALAHAGGSSFVISNSPQVYNDIVSDAVSLTRTNVITGANTFSSTTPPKYDANPVWSNFASTTFASLAYVNQTATSGAANASEAISGISQLATASQASAGTSLGSTGARLVLPSSLGTTTCQTAANSVVISSSTTGKIDQRCIDQTAPYTWTTATSTFNATTSIAAKAGSSLLLDGVGYNFPAAQGAASSSLINDGSGNLSWGIGGGSFAIGQFSTTTLATNQTITLRYSFPTAPRLISFSIVVQCTNTNISSNSISGVATSTSGQEEVDAWATANSTTNFGASGGTGIVASYNCNGSGSGSLTVSSMTSTSTVLTAQSIANTLNQMFINWEAFQ